MPVCPHCGQHGSEVAGKCPNDAFYLVPDAAINPQKRDPHLGRLVAGKYIMVSLISEGGMGAVYRAIQTPVDREVAIKVLKAELEKSAEGAERFFREARAVSKLSHPNIITLFDFGLDELQHPYMAMEFVSGVSLARWLRNDALTLDRILHVSAQIASALAEAHTRGVVHRDLKPENIMIGRSGSDPDFVKLLDFGIARVVNANATKGLTREGEVFGTPHYMSPEQAKGESNIGPPADVYAIGIMLFEMLTGKMPFDAPTPLSVLYQHLHEPLPPLQPRPNVTISRELEHIVRTATQKHVQDRYQTGSELQSAIQAFQSGVKQGPLADSLFGPSMTMPGSQPLVRPTANLAPVENIPIHDPEPSIIRLKPVAPPAPTTISKPLLGLVAFLAVLVIGGVGFLATQKEVPVIPEDVATNVPVTPEGPTEAVVPKTSEPVEVVEPVKVEPAAVEPEVVEPETEKVAAAVVTEEPVKDVAKTEATKVSKPKTEVTTTAKTEPAKTTETAQAAETTTTKVVTRPLDSQDDEGDPKTKKVDPRAFKPVNDPRKW